MPSARPATAPPRRQSRTANPRPKPRPQPRTTPRTKPRPRIANRGLRGRVRWDRVGRVSLLIVLTVVAGLYVQRGLAYLSVRSQASQQKAIVQQLTRSNASLRAQQRSLGEPATILSDARALGMVRPGEHPYEITGLPGH
ncbi:MAG TPA: septum formation initiator family protein [Solirubrobacteraceae bacterium]|nr:septum formation initiator family protein [Solirubrobacteraceae bacterium]HUA04320.1 septum formation initiator family protein [Solirubrobacteraceae bacterium]